MPRSAPQPKSRNWCWTVNNYTDDDLKKIDDWHKAHSDSYIIYGKEVAPTTGTPHLQGYTHLTQPRAWTAIKKLGPRLSNIKACKGSPKENITYCSKEGDVTTYGPEPMTQQERNKQKSKRFIDLSKAGDFATIEEEDPSKFIC